MSKQALLELAKDKPELVEYINKLEDTAAGLEPVKKAKAEIEAERDELKGTIKDLKAKKADGTASAADLATLNALTEKVDSLTKEISTIKTERDSAVKESRMKDLRASVVSAASTEKAMKPDDLFLLLQAKQLVGHDDKGAPFFRKLNDKGEPVAVGSADEAIKAFKGSSPEFFQPSGTSGSGGTPGAAGSAPFDAMKHL